MLFFLGYLCMGKEKIGTLDWFSNPSGLDGLAMQNLTGVTKIQDDCSGCWGMMMAIYVVSIHVCKYYKNFWISKGEGLQY